MNRLVLPIDALLLVILGTFSPARAQEGPVDYHVLSGGSIEGSLECLDPEAVRADGTELVVNSEDDYRALIRHRRDLEECRGWSLPDIGLRGNDHTQALVGRYVPISRCHGGIEFDVARRSLPSRPGMISVTQAEVVVTLTALEKPGCMPDPAGRMAWVLVRGLLDSDAVKVVVQRKEIGENK